MGFMERMRVKKAGKSGVGGSRSGNGEVDFTYAGGGMGRLDIG